ncbi:hypothetical protein [Mesorhizobium sp. M1027]|uniref:hypothetical protein n=1 Tax=Mesorhizobium sp. M1027 TaxID=2957050 RepID=UPI0033359928
MNSGRSPSLCPSASALRTGNVQTDNEGRDCREATARGKKLGFRSRSIGGGTGAITRTLGLLGAIFAWGIENDRVTANPVRAYALCRCSEEGAADCNQYRLLAGSLRVLECKRDRNNQPLHSLTGIAGIRFIAMIGVRKESASISGENEVDANGSCIALEETKTGFSLRPLGRAAFATIDDLDPISDFVFAAEAKGAGYKDCPVCGARSRRQRGNWRRPPRGGSSAARSA